MDKSEALLVLNSLVELRESLSNVNTLKYETKLKELLNTFDLLNKDGKNTGKEFNRKLFVFENIDDIRKKEKNSLKKVLKNNKDIFSTNQDFDKLSNKLGKVLTPKGKVNLDLLNEEKQKMKTEKDSLAKKEITDEQKKQKKEEKKLNRLREKELKKQKDEDKKI